MAKQNKASQAKKTTRKKTTRKQKGEPHLPHGMNSNQFNMIMNELTLKQMNANLALTLAQIQHNHIAIASMRNQAYINFLSELRSLTNTYQIDIEKTILMSEPKYKPLFDGLHFEALQDTILKVVTKLKDDLEIK